MRYSHDLNCPFCPLEGPTNLPGDTLAEHFEDRHGFGHSSAYRAAHAAIATNPGLIKRRRRPSRTTSAVDDRVRNAFERAVQRAKEREREAEREGQEQEQTRKSLVRRLKDAVASYEKPRVHHG
jgi:hypothetical protein